MSDWLVSARDREPEWLAVLAEIVDIESGPGDRTGIGRVYDALAARFSPLGFTDQRLPTAGPDVFLAHRPAAVDGALKLVLIGHADTVFATGTLDGWAFHYEGDRVTGPGTADMKGGLVAMLAGLTLAGEAGLDLLDLTVLVNGDEESGSAESRETIERLAPGFDTALVFEPGRPPNRIVSSRRGAHRFEVEVKGRPAHTGVNPEDGANAIETAAHHVLAIQALGRSIPGATVNAVIISGGKRPNIVPDLAVIRVDSRFDNEAAERQVVEGMDGLVGDGPVAGARTEIRSLDRRPAFESVSASLEAIYQAAATELGLEIESAATGGSSDGNFTSAAGVPTLDGLGAVGHEYHTRDEYVLTSSLAERAALLARVLQRIGDRGT